MHVQCVYYHIPDREGRVMKKLGLFFLHLCLGFLCLLTSVQAEEPQNDPKIIAKAGKYVLTVDSFNRKVETLPPEYQQMLKCNPLLRQSLIDRWVHISLLSQEARTHNLDSAREVVEKIDDSVNTILAREFVTKYVLDKIKITLTEIKNYYTEHPREFEEPEQVRARHILIKVPVKATSNQWLAAEARAYEIEEVLDTGEDFALLAENYSEDPSTKYQGGDLGLFARGQMDPEFEREAFALPVGEVSEPVKTVFGYHIIKVDARIAAKAKALEEVREEIKKRLVEEKQKKALADILSELEKKYGVTINR